jgi:hypothetical protein
MSMIRKSAWSAAALIGLLWPGVARAQQRPLVTEDPETIGAGLVLVEGGVDYLLGARYPVSGLEGNLLSVPVVGVSLGVGAIAELQIDGSLYERLSITDRLEPVLVAVAPDQDRTSTFGDLTVGTKVRLVGETAGLPAFGVRLATRLPTASTKSGLGLGTTDFYATLLGGKTVQSVRVVGNVGIGLIGDPTTGGRHRDDLLYGASFARAMAEGLEIVAEINGRVDLGGGQPPPGTESRGIILVGGRYTRGAGRVDGGLLVGMTSFDPSIGFTFGFTYVFNAFKVP